MLLVDSSKRLIATHRTSQVQGNWGRRELHYGLLRQAAAELSLGGPCRPGSEPLLGKPLLRNFTMCSHSTSGEVRQGRGMIVVRLSYSSSSIPPSLSCYTVCSNSSCSEQRMASRLDRNVPRLWPTPPAEPLLPQEVTLPAYRGSAKEQPLVHPFPPVGRATASVQTPAHTNLTEELERGMQHVI